jgi:hypothetical protein
MTSSSSCGRAREEAMDCEGGGVFLNEGVEGGGRRTDLVDGYEIVLECVLSDLPKIPARACVKLRCRYHAVTFWQGRAHKRQQYGATCK